MTWFENPNGVTREHFQMAIDAAAECTPEEGREPYEVPRVGAVIVKDGNVMIVSHRNQVGSGAHAEYIALEKSGIAAKDFIGADLISTLEPCSAGRHGTQKRPCVEWIIDNRIRKVWMGCLDRNPRITGQAIIKLRESNPPIEVGWFPDDMTPQILKQNQEFFQYISDKQPQLNKEQSTEKLAELRSLIKEELDGFQAFLLDPYIEINHISGLEQFRSVVKPNRIPNALSSEIDGDDMIQTADSVVRYISNAYSKSLSMNPMSISDWSDLADTLMLAHEIGQQVFRNFGLYNQAKSRRFIEYLKKRSRLETPPESGEVEEQPEYEAKFQKNIFNVGIPGYAYETVSLLDRTAPTSYIGKALASIKMGEHEKALDLLESKLILIDAPNQTVAGIYYEAATIFHLESECIALLAILRSFEYGFSNPAWLLSRTRQILLRIDCQWHIEHIVSTLNGLARHIRIHGDEELADRCLSLTNGTD